MARATFGGMAGDFVASVGPGGSLRARPATLTLWTADEGGSQVTDLLLDGSPVTSIPVGNDGQVPEFQGPDDVYELWADAGGGSRVRLTPDLIGVLTVADSATAALVANPASDTAAALTVEMEQKTYASSDTLGGTYLKTVSDILNGEAVDVLRAIPRAQHAAILDKTTAYDVTADVQGIADDMPHGTLVYPRGLYRQGNVQIQDKLGFRLRGEGGTIQLTGTGAVGQGFQFLGTVEDFEASGLRIVGDGAKANKHAGFWSGSGQTLANIRIHHNVIRNVMLGITLNANLSGSIDGFELTDNVISDVVGIASGQGYALHVAFLNAGSAKGLIGFNRVHRAGRHGVYVARASNVDVIGNRIYDHRAAITAAEQVDATDGWGRYRLAIFVARSKHIAVLDNTIVNFYDGGIQLDCDPEGVGGITAYDLTVKGNVLRQPLNNVQPLVVGSIDPTITKQVEDVEVAENVIWADYSTTPGVTSQDAIVHNAGKNVRYRDNRITTRGANATTHGINVLARGETAGTATYTEDVSIAGNDVHMTTSSGATCRGIRLATEAVTSVARITVKNNDASGDARDSLVVLAATSTNPNLRVFTRDGGCVGLYAAGDTTPSVARGVTVLPIANASAVSITALDDGVDGQRVDLCFDDANTTLVNGTNLRLAGGANFTPTVRDVIGFVRRAGSWYQAAPVVNN